MSHPYFDCYLIPVATAKLAAYKRFSQQMMAVYVEYGAVRITDCILDPATTDGTQFHAEAAQDRLQASTLRDFPTAAATQAGETVILSWTEWPSKAIRDAALPRVLADPRVQPKPGEDMIFDGSRLISGGFFHFASLGRVDTTQNG
ncbi:MAG: DUF1428 domain-containing protein [Cypionkella sp.]|uniref:DUF1428 domain-containing protein n=1 Tax=Cypionkella sp. TaxID=2811411 RepID=UPI002AB94499|nr:DUF1428 domain-containing protein [Cypionkella sp.]MDZ4312309.1 DUF1428 domain-containing protein [Cypionkella sp.]